MKYLNFLLHITWTNVSIIPPFVLLTAIFASAASVNLNWSPNNPAPEGYRVFSRKSDQQFDYNSPIWEGSESACIIEGLEDQTEYYFVIQPFDGTEVGDFSSEIHYVTPAVNAPQGTLEEGESPLQMDPLAEQKNEDDAGVKRFSNGLQPQGIPSPPVPLSAEFFMADGYFLVLSLDDQATEGGEPPAATHWQIYETQSKHCVLDLISDRQLSQLRVSNLSFKNGIKYYWRARFFNSKGRISDWSEPHDFTSDVTSEDNEDSKYHSPT
jgi:hypothetical protein